MIYAILATYLVVLWPCAALWRDGYTGRALALYVLAPLTVAVAFLIGVALIVATPMILLGALLEYLQDRRLRADIKILEDAQE